MDNFELMCYKSLLAVGSDWPTVFSLIEQLSHEYSYQQIWQTIRKIIVNLELYQIIPSRVEFNDYIDPLYNKYKKVKIGVEWLLKTNFNFITLNELVVGLNILHDYLGGNLTKENNNFKVKSGIPKHERKGLIDSKKIPELSAEEVANALGFVKEN